MVLACLRLGDDALRRGLDLLEVSDFYTELRGERAQDLRVGCDLADDRRLPQRRRHIVALFELLEFFLTDELGQGIGKPLISKLRHALRSESSIVVLVYH